MGIIGTNLGLGYAHNLKLDYPLRELEANGHDAEAAGFGEFSIEYNARATHEGKTGCVTMFTEGAKLRRDVMVMGVSGSRARRDAIGEFGEGLPLSFLVLARNDDLVSCVIYNDDEQWTPYLAVHEELECVTLHIRTRKLKKRRNGFMVKVWGIHQEEYDTLLKKFLKTHPDYDESEVVTVGYTGESILMDPKFKGLIYNKGVLVMARPDKLSYGYNLHQQTNRDRELMDQWDLELALSRLTVKAFESDPERFGDHIIQLLDDTNSMEAAQTYAYTTSSEVVRNVADLFVEKWGEDAVPVSSMGEAQQLSHVGKKGIIVGNRRLEVLTKDNRIKGIDDALDDGKMAIKRIVQWHELTKPELTNLAQAYKYLQSTDAIEANSSVAFQLQIVEFGGESIQGTFKREGGKAFICLSHKLLGNLHDMVVTLFHEVAHLEGGDGTVEHERRQVELLAQALLRTGGK